MLIPVSLRIPETCSCAHLTLTDSDVVEIDFSGPDGRRNRNKLVDSLFTKIKSASFIESFTKRCNRTFAKMNSIAPGRFTFKTPLFVTAWIEKEHEAIFLIKHSYSLRDVPVSVLTDIEPASRAMG
jgi:hypothetical protein